MDLSILQTLGIVDCAVLLRVNKSQFRLLDAAGSWIYKLIPNASVGQTTLIDEESLFLNDFLLDAEQFWATHYQGQVKSGIWTEQNGKEVLYLEAYAAVQENRAYLILKNAEQLYHERKHTLQIARELTISNDEVMERHDYLSERLRSILIDHAQINSRLPLHEAIRYANIGVVITDHKMFVQEINPAAFDIFDLPANKNHDNLLQTIIDLIDRQYPEKSIFKGSKHWSGELFWHTPPISSKWLKININPVLSTAGQISHWIISFSDQTRIKHLLQTNEELALHDPLTGLPNRQYFWQTLQSCVTNEEPFYLLSIDIINFKNANELYGYLEGDNLLVQVAKRLSKNLAKDDFITRIGADEFMIIRKFNKANKKFDQSAFSDDTLNFANELTSACCEPYFTKDDRRCELPVKIGIAEYPSDAKKTEELLNCADLALSFAKIEVNTNVQFYTEQLKEASKRRLLLENALKDAIENDELELYLQPIYDINSGKIIKAEALLRWCYKGVIVMPDEFIPIAEASDSINVIGRWVISRACEIIKRLESNNIKVPLCVNFSPKQIYDINLISFIRSNIEMMNIDTQMLELEVTEGVLINNYQKVSTFLHELKLQGVSISVDDFGTGYCSLAYLKHLPIDSLKIDRSFIKDVATCDDDNAIVTAIIALAQKLNLGIVAEGIETNEQQAFLLANNCNVGQGFLFSKPVNLDSFEKLFVGLPH